MRRHSLLAALALLATPLASAPAHAEDASGLLCGFDSVSDPQVEGSQTGVVTAGPLVVTDDFGLPASAHLFCTIQVNAGTHAGPDAATCVMEGFGVVAGGCTATYAAATGDNVYLCTEIWIYAGGHKTLFWNASNDPLAEGHWTTDPNAACGLTTSVESDGAGGDADPIVCPVLATMFPPEGDVGGVWDCPPYSD